MAALDTVGMCIRSRSNRLILNPAARVISRDTAKQGSINTIRQ